MQLSGGVFLNSFRADFRHSISAWIAVLCTVLYVWIALSAHLGLHTREYFFRLLGLSYAGLMVHGLWYQLLTAPLIHGGAGHLIFNMVTLWMLGPDIERAMGMRNYLLFSLFCALSGNLGFLILDRDSIVCGYSGVLFGLFVALAFFFPNRQLFLYGLFPVKMKYAALLLAAIEGLFVLSNSGGNIAHAAHLFGAIGGLFYLAVYRAILSLLAKPAGPSLSRSRRGGVEAREPSVSTAIQRLSPPWVMAIARVTDALGQGSPQSVARLLDDSQLRSCPKSLKTSLRELAGTLSGLAEKGQTDEDVSEILTQLRKSWKSVLEAQSPEPLCGLAHLAAAQCIDEFVDDILDALDRSSLAGSSDVRRELEEAVKRMGGRAFQIVARRLARTPANDPKGEWILDFAAGLEPGKRGGDLVRCYREMDDNQQQQLVSWFSKMSDTCPDILLDILAGTLKFLPRDTRFPSAVIRQIGAQRLNQIALRWAARGHENANFVLSSIGQNPVPRSD